ncbi:metalloregulator ArsR/SmtB family transcription factor [Rhizobium sp. FKL33]|uniref:ArsR/SmtB family transcription factor n=1 Tax=Rhizobium sp. FKL33 TaxID=2562307 RepID=UPI0010C08202|nr:metalloregulator ArsR/SmtB family transcription factor [Rhizobium sp. FKL33]
MDEIETDKQPVLSKLTALSHAGRLDIFRLLVTAGGEGLNAGEIAVALELRPNTLSQHLTMLSAAHLIRAQREGRNIRYFAEIPAMGELLGFLMQDCCGRSPDLCRKALDTLKIRK